MEIFMQGSLTKSKVAVKNAIKPKSQNDEKLPLRRSPRLNKQPDVAISVRRSARLAALQK